MAGKGPPRTPKAILKLRGSGLVRMRPDEPDFDSTLPVCPDWMDSIGREEWNRIVPQFAASGVIKKIDETALIAICQAWSDYMTARADVERDGKTFRTPQGYIAKNPMVTIMNEAFERWRKLAVMFGMSPSARTTLPKPEDFKQTNGISKFKLA